MNPMHDTPQTLTAQAHEARALIATLAQSMRGTQLRSGGSRPLLWGTASARDLVALLVKLANDDTHTTAEGDAA